MPEDVELAPGDTVQVNGLSVAAGFRVEAADDRALTLTGPDLGLTEGDHITVGHLVGWHWTAAAGRVAFVHTPQRRRTQIGVELTHPLRAVERRLGYRADLEIDIELLVPDVDGLRAVRGQSINVSTSGAAMRTPDRPAIDVQVPSLIHLVGVEPIVAVARVVGVTPSPRSGVRITFDQMHERDRRRLGQAIRDHVLAGSTV
jgi:hypothetical protein